MDINQAYPDFYTHLITFCNKMRTFRVAIYKHDEIKKIMDVQSISAMNILIKYEKLMLIIEDVMKWVVSIDIIYIATHADISDTSRGDMINDQRILLNKGNVLIDAIVDHTNHVVIKLQDYASIESYLREKIAARDIGPITSKIARHFVPLMKGPIAREICMLLNDVANDILGASHTAIDASRAIYDQVVACSNIISHGPSMTRVSLFAKFDVKYDDNISIEDNIVCLARKCECDVIIMSKVMKSGHAIEFDDRLMFDEEYITRADFSVPILSGLCDKIIARFSTVRSYEFSARTVPNIFRTTLYHPARYVLILETIDGDLLRIMHHGLHTIRDVFTSPEYCQYLIAGQSTRSIQYHDIIAQEIEKHIARGGVTNVVNMFITNDDQEMRRELSSSMSSRIETFLRAYLDGTVQLSSENIIRAIIPVVEWSQTRSSIMRARYLILADEIARDLLEIIAREDSAIRAMEVNERNEALRAIVLKLDLGELCVKNISLYAILQNIRNNASTYT